MANGIRPDLERALAEATIGPGAQRSIPFQVRRTALERPPVIIDRNILNSPILQPIFGQGAIPPVFDEADDGLSDVGVDLGTGQGTFTGEPIDIGNASIGAPVPPVKESRGDRLRALLGNFLQNFGTGLQAASRAPSGAEFAAGFGGALGAGEERRQQKSREDLLRANQTFRLAEAAERKRRFDLALEAGEAQREQDRIDEENAANRALQAKLAEIDADEAQSNIQRIINRQKAKTQAQREERRFRRGIAGQKELRRFEDTLLRNREARRPAEPALEVKEALTQARLELSSFVNQDALLPPSKQRFSGTFGIARFQNLINERAAALLGRKPTTEEKRQIADTKRVREFVSELSTARKTLGASEDDLFQTLRIARQQGEINDLEVELIGQQLGLLSSSERRRSIEQLKERLRPTPVRRFLKGAERIFTPAIEAFQGKRPFIGEPEPER